MLRIAIVTPMMPVPFDQTRGRYIYETARALSKRADVRVFFQQASYPRLSALKARSFMSGQVGEDYRIEGLDVEAFTYPALPVVSRGLNGWLAARRLLPKVEAFRPDVVLAYWIFPDGFAAVQVARKLRVPAVIGGLGSDIHVRAGLTATMTRKTIDACDALIVVSEAMAEFAVREFGADSTRVHTIVNGHNTSVFKPMPQRDARASLGVDEASRMLVYVGRVVRAKGLYELVEAFQSLSTADPRARLVIVGDGVDRVPLEREIGDRGLGSVVSVIGGRPPEEVALWIGASDALVLPSWSEGYPNVVVESIACGRPVVATDVGGTREIVGPDNGLLIKPKDVPALEQAMASVLARTWDPESIAASRRRTWDDVADETLEVCSDLVALRRT